MRPDPGLLPRVDARGNAGDHEVHRTPAIPLATPGQDSPVRYLHTVSLTPVRREYSLPPGIPLCRTKARSLPELLRPPDGTEQALMQVDRTVDNSPAPPGEGQATGTRPDRKRSPPEKPDARPHPGSKEADINRIMLYIEEAGRPRGQRSIPPNRTAATTPFSRNRSSRRGRTGVQPALLK